MQKPICKTTAISKLFSVVTNTHSELHSRGYYQN